MARNVSKLALELRSRTTQPLAWIANRLNMGTRGHLAWLLLRREKGRKLTDPFMTPLLYERKRTNQKAY
jgi:hypothetical protein